MKILRTAGLLGPILLLLVCARASAATLALTPAAKTVAVGQSFTVTVSVSSPDQPMNAASGDITFPADKLEVVSIYKTGSIIDQWTRDPSFSNSVNGGNVHFEGIVFNPGYTGPNGSIVKIVFRAIAAGSAAVEFVNGSVLANDGNGTNILDGMVGATYTMTVAPPPPASPPAAAVDTSAAPAAEAPTSVTSSTNAAGEEIVLVPSASPAASATLVTVNGWFFDAPSPFGLPWLWLGILLLGVGGLGFAVGHASSRWTLRSYHREIVREQKELHDDLRRIERELESGRVGSHSIHDEVEHLAKDIAKGK